MKKFIQLSLPLILSATFIDISCQNIAGTLDSIFITPLKFNNEHIAVEGTVTQYIPGQTNNSSFYILKSDYGATIKIITSSNKPELYKKYTVKGIVQFEASGPIIIETGKTLFNNNETVSRSNQIKVDVDKDIPKTNYFRKTSYALIIGNEDYTSFQENLSSEVNVDYAINDAEVVNKYLLKTIGIPEKNITLLKNATYGQMMRAIKKLETITKISGGDAELIFYYSGHGLPHEQTKESYIIPVDASATALESAIKLNDVFKKFTNYPSLRVIAVIDACFSGGGRNQGLLTMKSVRFKPSAPSLNGNLLVFSSSTGVESSGVYREKQHGMFTYYFLKKLQESKGDISMKELADYIQDKVELESVIINNKRQTPQILFSPDVEGVWERWRLVE